MSVANRAREVAVPDVMGESVDGATERLATIGLGLRVDGRRGDPSVPRDHVLEQDPVPGTILRRQQAVRVHVSDGLRDPVVPNVVGQADRSAEILLTQEDIETTRTEIRSTTYPAGTVVAQDPSPDARASAVTLLVNQGERGLTYVMPDVIGTPAGIVVDLLRRRGFRVTVAAEVPYADLPPGIVIRQTPQAGYQVGYGDAVQLEVTR
jgi:beta-lactam-binding protein with PASTA domain